MTEDEKRQQKAMLLLEYQEAENNFAHVREKVSRLHAPFSEVTKWLNQAAQGYSDFPKINANIRANLGTYQKLVNFSEAIAVLDELAAAEESLQQLRKRKNDLGLK